MVPALWSRRPVGDVWILAAIVLAIAVAAVSAIGGTALAALTVAVVLPAIVVIWGATMTDVLVASIFLEVISFGGLTISRLLAPLALVVLVVSVIRGRVRFHPGPLLIPMTAYVLWALASGIWTVSLPHTQEILGSLMIALVYMASFAILVHDERDLRRTLSVLAIASLAIGLVSTLSFAGVISIFGGDSLQSGRGQGGVGDPNFFANVQLVALPVILVLATSAKTKAAKAIFGFATIVAITSIFATLSRGAMIALVVLIVVVPFIPAPWLIGTPRQKAAVLLILAVCLGGLFTRPTFRAEVIGRVQTLFVPQSQQAADGSSSGSGRTELWKAGMASIRERPALGLGLGAFPSQSNRLLFGTPGVKLDLIAAHPNGIEVHSAYIGTAVDLGFIGLTAFLAMIGTTIVWLGQLAARARRLGLTFVARIASALVLSMIAWAISSTFIETETARPLWIVMGLAFAIGKLVHRAEHDVRRARDARWETRLVPAVSYSRSATPFATPDDSDYDETSSRANS